MDPIEAQHIRTHLTELVQKTKCNVTLIAYIREKGLISEEDKQDLNGKTKTDIEKAMHLYDILQTRKGAYAELIQALKTTAQTGPVEILQELYNKMSKKPVASTCEVMVEPPPKKAKTTEHNDDDVVDHSVRPGEILQSESLRGLIQKQFHDSVILKDLLPASFKDPIVKKPKNSMRFNDDDYKLPTGFKGLFLLINIVKFDGVGNTRNGAAVDTRRLEVVFETLGYEVYTHTGTDKTFTRELFSNLIDTFKNRCVSLEVKSFAVFLGSHGTDGKLIMSNGDKVDLETEVFTKLCTPPDNDNLIGRNYWQKIPKMFFIQACRSREKDKLPTISNCLISYACKSDTFSWRTTDKGSDYVAALTNYLCKYAAEKDICYVLDKVCTSVRDTSQKYMQKAEDLQEPEYVRRGEFKKLYFNMLPTK